jgi:lipoteichoic acid synthase
MSLIDTAPTILDLLGLEIPSSYQGLSLLCGTNPMALFYADYSLALLGLRDENWKCIHEVESGRSKLFDLARDPNERENLALLHPARVNLYREHLLRWSAAQRELITRSASGHSKDISIGERAGSLPSALLD